MFFLNLPLTSDQLAAVKDFYQNTSSDKAQIYEKLSNGDARPA